MELLIPSLVALLLAVSLAYFVMPKAGPPILVAVGLGLIVAAEYVHWSQFGVSEYEHSTWQNNLRKYGSFIIIGVILLAAYAFYTINQGGMPSLSSMATPALPAVQAPTVGGALREGAHKLASRMRAYL